MVPETRPDAILWCFLCLTGHQGTKLEIHVCDGDRYHAVMQTKFLLNDGFPPTVERQMVE